MADNLNVTQGSGTIVRTDDVGGVHYQVVKIDIGGNGVSVPLNPGQEATADSIPVALSTEQETLLSDIESAVDGLEAKDFATQTTLAAILAKIIAAPATEAKQDTLIGHVDGLEGAFTTLNAKDFATQTTLAAVLAKIIAAPATEAKQDTIIGHVDGLETLIGTTNTTLTTIDGRVDGLETLVTSTNTKLDTIHTDLDRTAYETVAAGQTDQVLGATGATGDILERVIIIPANTSPGAVSIKDGSGSAITIFVGGASSVDTLAPIFVTLGMKSTGGAWKLTTGADVSAIGIGKFTA